MNMADKIVNDFWERILPVNARPGGAPAGDWAPPASHPAESDADYGALGVGPGPDWEPARSWGTAGRPIRPPRYQRPPRLQLPPGLLDAVVIGRVVTPDCPDCEYPPSSPGHRAICVWHKR